MVLSTEMSSISSVDALQLIIKHLNSVIPAGLTVDPNMSFIEMGMDSLLIASLELYLKKHFDIQTGFLNTHKTPKECAEKLSSISMKRPIQQKLQEKVTSTFPLSQAQKRLIFSASKHTPFEQIQIKVPNLDVQKFTDAWQLVSKRHSILRTCLSLNGQQILDESVKLNDQFEGDVLRNPLRIQLINKDTINLEYHHSLIDGTSINFLMNELHVAYKDLNLIENEPIPAQYFEYCLFEEKHLEENKSNWSKIVNYWIEELQNFEEIFEDCHATTKSKSLEWTLDEQTSKQLFCLAAQNEMTIFNLMSGLIRVLYYKLFDADDLIVGFPIEQRLHADFEKTIGLFMNFNICRVKLDSEQTLLQFSLNAAQKTTEITHGHMPFNQLINHLQSKGILESEKQLLQLIIVNDKQTCPHTEIEVTTTAHSILYPKVVYIQYGTLEEEIRLRIEFDEEKFITEDVENEIRLFERLCQKFINDPNQQIRQLSLTEDQLFDLDVAIPKDFLHCILDKLNNLLPNKIILKSHDQQFNVKDFLENAWNAAHNLKEIVTDDGNDEIFIALMLPRTPDLIFSLFAAWLNGYIVIPLNYQKDVKDMLDLLPPTTFIISDQLIHSHLKDVLIDRVMKKNKKSLNRSVKRFDPNSLCYCTFTSGSTGESKLVMSERVGLSNLLRNYTQEFGYSERSTVYQVVNPAFDIFLADVVTSFANESTLILAKHPIPCIKEIETNTITHAYIMPAFLPKMNSNEEMKVLANLEVLMFGGESINEEFVRKALAFKVNMVQLFGFTEHAVYTNFQRIRQLRDCSLIGKPFEGTRAIVVDKDNQLKPTGFKGNLLSIGLGVCRGYFGVEKTTGFPTFNSQRAFSTNDICQQQQNNCIQFFGRQDDILKLNGQKVYMKNIDQQICQLDSVQQAATIVLKTENGTKDWKQKLIAFVVTENLTEEVLNELKEKNPHWTLPIKIQKIDVLPLNSNGKIDKRQLMSIANESDVNKIQPINTTQLETDNEERIILDIFQQFLGKNYQLNDDFLSAGIDSLQLLQVVQALEKQLHIELDVRYAFKSQNAREWLKKKNLKPHHVEVTRSNLQASGPVTWNQEHVWLTRDFQPEFADSYKIKLELLFREELDEDRFIEAVNRIVKENESLRVSIQLNKKENQLMQFVLPYQNDWILTPNKYPILLKFQSNQCVDVEFDHSTVDGYSLRLIVDALLKYYKNPSATTNFSTFSPIKFAEDQRRKSFSNEIEFFTNELSDVINDCLPTELPRPTYTEQKASHERFAISLTNFNNLTDCRFNLFYFTLTAYLKQLSEETNRKSVTIGIPFANRSSKNANAVGYFANALPIQMNVEVESLTSLVEQVQEKVLQTLQFSELPFSLLVRRLHPKRSRQVNPIFQRMLMFEDYNIESFKDLEGCFEVREIDSDYAKFDQTWHSHKNSKNQLEVHVEYDKALFTAEGVRRSLRRFEEIFNQLITAFSNDSSISTTLPTNKTECDEITNKLFKFLKEELTQLNSELNENSNFFELGLHSLNAALLASRIRNELNLSCSTKQIFEHQTIAELSAMLNRQHLYEVSYLQQTILRFMKENPSKVLRDQYCNEFSVKVDEANKEKIETALFQLIREQEALRTRFIIKDGKFMMEILPEHELNQKLPYIVKSEDFQMETVFIEMCEGNKLHFRLSHLISDGQSMQIMRSMQVKSQLSTSKKSIADFNLMFNKKCRKNTEKTLEFWKSALKTPNGSLFRDNYVQVATKSETCTVTVSKQLVINKLKTLKVSLNAFLLHKLAETLKHWQSIEDESKQLYIGVAKDMRGSDFSQTIGFFTQTLPIPCKNKNLSELNALLFDVYENAFVCFEQLIEISNQSTLFEVMLVLDVDDVENELELNIEDDQQVNGKFPLTFHVKMTKSDIIIQLVYWSELWNEETALSMLKTFAANIEHDKIDTSNQLLSVQRQLTSFVDPIEKIHSVAQLFPDNIAIQSTTKSVTYRQLCQEMTSISTKIKQMFSHFHGDHPLVDSVILVAGQSSIKTLLTCLSVMDSGAAYLPVDQSQNSSARVRQIYEETKAKMIISNNKLFETSNWISFDELWPTDCNSSNIKLKLGATKSNLAYVIYTSGTTSTQKAVQIERQSLFNTIQDATDFFDVTPNDCIYQFTKFCFDNSVLEIFVALCNGAKLFVDEGEFNITRFCENIDSFKITHAFLYPGLVDTFTDEELKCMCKLKYWISGAEKLNKHLMDRALDMGICVLQNYGPTETTCYALRRRMQKGDDPQTIGVPVPGLVCRLSSEDTPFLAAPRELLISGVGLMRGYIGDETQRCFVQINNERFYKTGDLCRLNQNGEFVFVGRTDSVVKIRGFRVDLNEVETAVLCVDQIKQVKILVDQENISAYFVATQQIEIADLKAHCINCLPRYAVPNIFYQIEKMPLTSNNKIDSKALLVTKNNQPDSMFANKCVLMNENQQKISKIWSDMFRRQVGSEESFFEIGGNSLSAQRMLNQLESVFDVCLSIADLMLNPTIIEIEKLLTSNKKPPSSTIEVNQTQFPLSFQQEQMLFLEEISTSGEYNLQCLQFFTKELDCKRLLDALEMLVIKNEILRTKIVEVDGEFYQTIEQNLIEQPPIEQITTDKLKQLIKESSTKRFDLFGEVAFKLRFFDVDNNRYCLFVEQHHLISDATSTMMIEEQISNSYNGIENNYPSISYSQWSVEQKSKRNEFEGMSKELKRELSSITDKIEVKKELTDSEVGSIRTFTVNVELDTNIKTSPFTWFCTQIVRVFATHFGQKTLVIGAPVQNRNEKTERTLGNFLNNIIIPLNYNPSLNFEDNLKVNKEAIANSLRFSELPFSFVPQISPFDVYVNCRYALENESSLQIREKCADILLEDYLPPKCHHFLEIDLDEHESGRFCIVWRTKSTNNLLDKLFNEFKNAVKTDYVESKQVKSTIRQCFQKTLSTDVKFSDSDDYFLIGGNSLSFLRLYRLLKSRLDLRDLDATAFLPSCSVNSIYSKVANIAGDSNQRDQQINIKVIADGSEYVFIFFPTLFGGFLGYRHVFKEMQLQNPKVLIIGVDVLDPTQFYSLDEMAQRCALNLWNFIEKHNINVDSINFVGASFGALFAYETLRYMKKHLYGFCSLVSIDGIANSNQVNSSVTFEQHKTQTEQSLVNFNLDHQTKKTIMQHSWHLLQLANRHSIQKTTDPPNFFLLMIARHSSAKPDYGWPIVGIQQRLVRIDGTHSSMMDDQKSVKLVAQLFQEILCRAKTLKKP